MTTPVNLNKWRKAKAKVDAKTRADENSARFGRTKAEKQTEAKTAQLLSKRLDGHKADDV